MTDIQKESEGNIEMAKSNKDGCVVIALANQKGGVGKTTSAINLAASVGVLGKRVLLVDLDPQGNATSGVGVSKVNAASVYDAIMGLAEPEKAIKKTKFGISVLPSCISLAGAEVELLEVPDKEYKLREVLDKVKPSYDYIFIDCPPSLGLLTINALTAADFVIVAMQCEYFALEGLTLLTKTIGGMKRSYNPELTICGIVITMYDGRLNLHLDVLGEVKKHFPNLVFKKPVPRNVKVSEAPSYGMPVYFYDKYSKGSLVYREIAKELIERTT